MVAVRKRQPAGIGGGKAVKLDALALALAQYRQQGKTIVHAHGVFDLLHIGHIRHLDRARRLGDVLVVTVTPDRFVNKGPHRPAFPEDLRVEALASLGCVDHVAINAWPTAVETITMLRPDIYVKGSEYRDAAADVTGGIAAEEAAVRAAGGRIAFTDEITYSSTSLINQHLPTLAPETTEYLRAFAARHPPQEVVRTVEALRDLKVLVVGEAIIDEYHYCEAIGKSMKEPMLAVKMLSSERFAGGSLAVANHLANFAGEVGLVTFLGARDSQEDFIRERLDTRIDACFLARSDSPTIVKRRFVEHYFFTKMLEVYDYNDGLLDEEDDRHLISALEQRAGRYDIVLASDFGHSLFTPRAIEVLCKRSRLLAVNAQCNAGNLGYNTVSKYARADYVCITENEVRIEARDRRGDIRRITQDIFHRMGCRAMCVTRGNRGTLTYAEGEGFHEVPALTRHVVDRMGAGDAVLAVTSLCVAQRVPMEVVGFLGNVVGAQAVATVGNRRAIDRVALLKSINALLG